jgi:hypothetical protein
VRPGRLSGLLRGGTYKSRTRIEVAALKARCSAVYHNDTRLTQNQSLRRLGFGPPAGRRARAARPPTGRTEGPAPVCGSQLPHASA